MTGIYKPEAVILTSTDALSCLFTGNGPPSSADKIIAFDASTSGRYLEFACMEIRLDTSTNSEFTFVVIEQLTEIE